MSGLLPALLIELALLLTSGSGAAPPSPVFHHDERLAGKVTLRKPALPLALVLQEVHRQLGVDLIAEGDLLKRSLTLAVTNRSGADLLTEIGLVTHGTWVKRNNGYLLLAEAQGGSLASRTPPLEYAAKAQGLLAGSFSRAQWDALQRDEPLRIGDLNADQRRLFMTVLVSEYQLHPDRHPRSLLSGQQCELHYVHGEPPQLAIVAPMILPDGSETAKPFALVNLR